MKKIFRKALALVAGLFILSSSFSVLAIDLNYSGGSTSNTTGAGNSTSGFKLTVINPTYGNNVGYRFSIVDGSGNLKSGSKVANIYLNDTTYGTAAYNSAQRFIVSAGTVANKKQLASNTKVTTAYSAQACEQLAGNAHFYSIPGQDPATIRSWIQDTSDNYKNLQRIYAVCGLKFENVAIDDYVLIEPILRVKLAGVITAATPTELAVYGASVSGGGQYNGANGKLSNTGSGTLWNLQYYINREFPNMLYVNKNTSLYSAVSVISSGRYTYNDIIQKGYGCSVLQVSNIIPTYTKPVQSYLDVNGVLDGNVVGVLDGWCLFDIYLNGNLYKQNISDFCEILSYGTSYTITNIRPVEGKRFVGSVSEVADPNYPSSNITGLSGVIGSDTQFVFLGLENIKSYLDVNGVLDGNIVGVLDGWCLFDIYLNGILYKQNISDFCEILSYGTSYTITNIRPVEGKRFVGSVSEVADPNYPSSNITGLSGVIGSDTQFVFLGLENIKSYLDVNGVLDGNVGVVLDGWCLFDIYLNGNLYKQNISDFCEILSYGTSYTITNIRPVEGKRFVGSVSEVADPNYPSSNITGLSGVIGSDTQFVFLGLETKNGITYKVQHWLQNIDGDASLKDSNNYTLDYTESLAGAAGESITPEVKAYKGFTSPATQTVTINPDGSTVVNYYYTRNRYTVTLNKGTGISATTGAGTYLYGASVTINATVSQGYNWSNWTGTYNTDTQKYTFTMPCENVTDTANAVLNTYTVVYDGNGSTGGSTPNSTHVYNVEKNLNANGYVRDGYSFLGWNTEADGTGTAYADMQTVKNLTSVNGGVVTLYAQWKRNVKIVYKVQHWLQNIDGNASIKNSDNYTLADSESFAKEIYGDVNSDGYVNSADLTYLKKMLLSMISEPITTGDVNGDGSTDILDLVRLKKYLAGAADESVTPGVKAYKGFTSPATQTVTINPDASTVVNYYYTRNRYTVTLNKGTGISATTGAGTYLYGASVTINATVSQGYTWSKWAGTYNTATQKYTFTMPAQNVTDTANAVPNTYTVVYDGNGSTGGSTPNSTHVYNVEKNLNANGYKKSGCTFIGWNTAPDGTGTAYTDKQTVKNLTSVNGGVVTLYAQWQARLTLVPLEPNAPYREDTEVITSYWIVNSSTENCIPSDNIKVAFTVYNANGDILKTADKTVIVPARDKNLIYFKWRLPEDLSRNDVTVKAVIKDGGSNYGLVSKSYATVPYIYYTTPDTEYEAKAPDGFSVPTAPTDTGILSAKWWEYKYENGSFKKVNYGIGTKLNLSPLSAPDSLSAQMTGGRLTLRSGYGFRSPFGAYTLGIEGYTMPDSASYTERQYAYALFPEFNYSFGENKCKTFKEVGNVFDFYDSYYTHINHYIPLYYPDGDYTFEIDVTDSWTPAGMITTSDLQTITVSGSLYDDHYIGRK